MEITKSLIRGTLNLRDLTELSQISCIVQSDVAIHKLVHLNLSLTYENNDDSKDYEVNSCIVVDGPYIRACSPSSRDHFYYRGQIPIQHFGSELQNTSYCEKPQAYKLMKLKKRSGQLMRQ